MLQNILNKLQDTYSKPFHNIALHREMMGYVCIVSSGTEKYVVKLFRSRQTEQALQSIAIMQYLDQNDFPIAHIIPTLNGMLYFTLEMEGESRIGVLYDYIDGVEPDKVSHIETIGSQTGKLHQLMQMYDSKLVLHEKQYFIDRYINVLDLMAYPNSSKFKEHGEMLWNRVKSLPRGFCHGDYHTGNMLRNTSGDYVLFDFDAAAAAFPLYDIAVVCDMTDYFSLTEEGYHETSHMIARFLKGYNEHRTISEEELHHIYDFIAIRHFEVQATIIETLGLSCVDLEFIESQYEWLMQWEKFCTSREFFNQNQ